MSYPSLLNSHWKVTKKSLKSHWKITEKSLKKSLKIIKKTQCYKICITGWHVWRIDPVKLQFGITMPPMEFQDTLSLPMNNAGSTSKGRMAHLLPMIQKTRPSVLGCSVLMETTLNQQVSKNQWSIMYFTFIDVPGPPLEGTSCGGQGTHWCKGGSCVPITPFKWGGWNEGVCRSACLANSVGYRENTRQCLILQVQTSQFWVLWSYSVSQKKGSCVCLFSMFNLVWNFFWQMLHFADSLWLMWV